jgi:predicted ArsR family transcriptional regulator
MRRNNLEKRVVLALVIGANCVFALSRMLGATLDATSRALRRLRISGLIGLSAFKHQRMGAPKAFYSLTLKGQAYAKELMA